MSKLLSLFNRGGGGNSSTEAIRQSTTMTMAYLLEQNRKFEFFMRQKVERLEQLVSSQQQTRAEFEEEEFEEDFADTGAGEDTSNDETAEPQPAARPSISVLVEDEPLTATRPSPKAAMLPAPETAPSSPPEEEGASGEDAMSVFGVSSSKTAGSTAEEADSEPLSWESYLGASAEEETTPAEDDFADEQAATNDEEAETNEHTEALTELSSQPDLHWVVDGLVRSSGVSEEEVAETYTPDMAEDTDGAVELGLVTVEGGKVVVEGEEEELEEVGDLVSTSDDSHKPLRQREDQPDHNHDEAVAGSGSPVEQPPKVTRSFRFPIGSPAAESGLQVDQPPQAEQGSEELKEEQNSRTTPTPVINKPSPVVVKSRETSSPPPVRITAQTLSGEEEEEEVEALLPAWLKNKLDKK